MFKKREKSVPPELEPEKKTARNASSPPVPFIQFQIVLQDIRPLIWRRFIVPEDLTLYKFHQAIQDVMGWWECHLHEFIWEGKRYGEPDPDFDFSEPLINDKRTRLSDLKLSVKDKMIYEYDFGDGWEHTLLVEKILPPSEERKKPVCLKGERACPPEDCGGPWGYGNILKIIRNPDHEEYESWMVWLPEGFDPENFDLEKTNSLLSARTWKTVSSPRNRRKKTS